MTFRDRPYPIFIAAAVAAFLVSTLGADLVARMTVRGDSFGTAFSEHLYYAVTEPLRTARLMVPFALLAWMSASLPAGKALERGAAVFLTGAILISILYFEGYHASRVALNERQWEDAVLALNWLPYKSMPLLLLCLGLRFLLGRVKRDGKPGLQ